MGWFDLSSWIPNRYAQDAQQMAPSAPATLGTAPETPGYTATGARRRFPKSKKGGKKMRSSKKTSRR
jgi:hypothetical protein